MVVSVFKCVGEKSTATSYYAVVFCLWLVKSLKNL